MKMKICKWGKDGGLESSVWGFWLVEIKPIFSIVLLKFEDGTREAFHNHAFHAISWLLTGKLREHCIEVDGQKAQTTKHNIYTPSLKPIITKRETFHKVRSEGRSWALSFRGPWVDKWQEYVNYRYVTLTHGRKEVS